MVYTIERLACYWFLPLRLLPLQVSFFLPVKEFNKSLFYPYTFSSIGTEQRTGSERSSDHRIPLPGGNYRIPRARRRISSVERLVHAAAAVLAQSAARNPSSSHLRPRPGGGRRRPRPRDRRRCTSTGRDKAPTSSPCPSPTPGLPVVLLLLVPEACRPPPVLACSCSWLGWITNGDFTEVVRIK